MILKYLKKLGYKIKKNGFLYGKYKKHSKIKGNIEKGYIKVYIFNKGIKKRYALHRLVAMCFIPNPNNYPCINHKNGIKTDNKIKNLEWCTYSQNTIHAFKNGLNGKHLKNPRPYRRKKIIRIDSNEIVEFIGIVEASKKIGISYTAIVNCLTGRSKTAGGYIWHYSQNNK